MDKEQLEQLNRETSRVIMKHFPKGQHCWFCNQNMQAELFVGNHPFTRKTGASVKLFCTCVGWQMMEADIELVHLATKEGSHG